MSLTQSFIEFRPSASSQPYFAEKQNKTHPSSFIHGHFFMKSSSDACFPPSYILSTIQTILKGISIPTFNQLPRVTFISNDVFFLQSPTKSVFWPCLWQTCTHILCDSCFSSNFSTTPKTNHPASNINSYLKHPKCHL